MKGERISWRTSSGYGSGNDIEGVVLDRVPTSMPAQVVLDGLHQEGRLSRRRKIPKGILNVSNVERLVVLVEKKNGKPVSGEPLMYPSTKTTRLSDQPEWLDLKRWLQLRPYLDPSRKAEPTWGFLLETARRSPTFDRSEYDALNDAKRKAYLASLLGIPKAKLAHDGGDEVMR